ncbi:MAG: cation transporter [Acholeplasmatales bacterium]|jgi:copper chaperone CopZ|nr:cation transporter [Acholeplasmatales bacterium]
MKLFIPNMGCKGCQTKIEEALNKENLKAKVVLKKKLVIFKDDSLESQVRKALDSIGYTAA